MDPDILADASHTVSWHLNTRLCVVNFTVAFFSLSFIKQTNKTQASVTTFLSVFYLNPKNLRSSLKYIYLSISLLAISVQYSFKKFLMYCLSVARGETVFEFASSLIDIITEKCSSFFFVSTFSHHLRKQFAPKPWQIKASTIVKHLYGMLIKNWQGETSQG